MARYITVRLTEAQLDAAINACDLIRDSHEAGGEKREAAKYARTVNTLQAQARAKEAK